MCVGVQTFGSRVYFISIFVERWELWGKYELPRPACIFIMSGFEFQVAAIQKQANINEFKNKQKASMKMTKGYS